MAIGTAVEPVATPQVTVWFDGDCPICSAEIRLLRRLDAGQAIAFVNLASPDVGPQEREARLARLHAQPRGGAMVSGAAAFVAMWRVLPGLRWMAVAFSFSPALGALERAYGLFLRCRPWLQRVATPVLGGRRAR